jgi:Ca2+-binding EF-hand superfamily protein
LDFASFVRLMTSKAVSEFQQPDRELLPAFKALDANGDGVITREEMRQAMACIARNLPIGDAESWAQRADEAFEALDRDKSGKLDYEEFVALMSGCLTSPYAL